MDFVSERKKKEGKRKPKRKRTGKNDETSAGLPNVASRIIGCAFIILFESAPAR
jgi:hypothetical protein